MLQRAALLALLGLVAQVSSVGVQLLERRDASTITTSTCSALPTSLGYTSGSSTLWFGSCTPSTTTLTATVTTVLSGSIAYVTSTLGQDTVTQTMVSSTVSTTTVQAAASTVILTTSAPGLTSVVTSTTTAQAATSTVTTTAGPSTSTVISTTTAQAATSTVVSSYVSVQTVTATATATATTVSNAIRTVTQTTTQGNAASVVPDAQCSVYAGTFAIAVRNFGRLYLTTNSSTGATNSGQINTSGRTLLTVTGSVNAATRFTAQTNVQVSFVDPSTGLTLYSDQDTGSADQEPIYFDSAARATASGYQPVQFCLRGFSQLWPQNAAVGADVLMFCDGFLYLYTPSKTSADCSSVSLVAQPM
nr:hypothetical protein B0A51_08667 [Rachicladosporium sp. CCFEE 5018]